MKTVYKIAEKIRRDGIRAVAAAIHRFADAMYHSKSDPVNEIRPANESATVNEIAQANESATVDAIPSAWSEYLSWLSFAVPGMLDRRNVDAMSFALQHLPNDAPIVEIGSFCGLSTCVINYLRHQHSISNRLFTCDRWTFEGQNLEAYLGDSEFVTHDQYRTFVRESYLRNIQMFCKPDFPYTIEADSDTFFQLWSATGNATDVFGRNVEIGGPLSFSYIDGNHAYEFAKRDFVNTDRFLAPGGFIFFDDSADGSGWEVCKVVEEVLKSGSYHLVAKNPNYLVQKRA
jgi:hypothetical protein